MVSFAVDKFGDVAAATLGRAWCHKMEHFYRIWLSQELWGYRLSEQDCQGYVPMDEYADFFLALDVIARPWSGP